MWDWATMLRRRGDAGWAACDGGEAASVQSGLDSAEGYSDTPRMYTLRMRDSDVFCRVVLPE